MWVTKVYFWLEDVSNNCCFYTRESHGNKLSLFLSLSAPLPLSSVVLRETQTQSEKKHVGFWEVCIDLDPHWGLNANSPSPLQVFSQASSPIDHRVLKGSISGTGTKFHLQELLQASHTAGGFSHHRSHSVCVSVCVWVRDCVCERVCVRCSWSWVQRVNIRNEYVNIFYDLFVWINKEWH